VVPADAKIIPGHGPLSDKAGLTKFRDVLVATRAAVAKAAAAGKTVEQMKSEKVLAEWDSWGQGFIKTDLWIEMLNRDLTAKKH
jgi:cyclase